MNDLPVSSETYAFTADGLHHQQQLEIVDANSLPPEVTAGYLDGLDNAHEATDAATVVTTDTATLLYSDTGTAVSAISEINATVEQVITHPEFLTSNPNHAELYATQDNDALAQESTNPVAESELDLEPIDLEEVQKIQARMPVADPSAPVGSNKNPIRIIQQGNQYITTQDVSDEHLQQIIQVLTNQALLSNSTSRPNAIYNRLTNRRIIFRVTKAKRRHDDTPLEEEGDGFGVEQENIVGGQDGEKTKRQKRNETAVEFDTKQESMSFPLSHQNTATTKRVARQPKGLQYNDLLLDDTVANKTGMSNDEPSEAGNSDYLNEGVSDDDTLLHCSVCNRSYMTRSGLVKHEKQCLGQEVASRGRSRANPYVTNMKRRTKLKEAITESTEEEIIQLAAPRVSKVLPPWDHLLMRSEEGKPPLPHVGRLVRDFLNLSTRIRSFLVDHLEPCDELPIRNDQFEDDEYPGTNGENAYVEIKNAEQSDILGLPYGRYLVKKELDEEYLPRRFRSAIVSRKNKPGQVSTGDANLTTSSRLVSVDTADDDNVQATLRSDAEVLPESQNQGMINLGDELLLLPDGGLGGPVPDDWITSGAFLAVLTETGETSDLVMEAATGRLFHRPTGHLVSLPDTADTTGTTTEAKQDAGQLRPVTEVPDYGAYEDEVSEPTVDPIVEEPAAESITQSPPSTKKPRPKSKARPKSKQKQVAQYEEPEPLSKETDAHVARREELLQKIAECGDVIDLNTLFPGVSVTEVSPGVCVVTKPNGDKFNVEHGGEGITLDTLQTILEMGT